MADPTGKCVNLLFTSIGRRVELVRAFRQAFRALQMAGNIVGVDIDPLAPALRLVDKPYIVPRLSSSDYIPTLIDICSQERIDIVLPLIDPDIAVLAGARKHFEEIGTRLAVVSVEAARIAADKWLTADFFQRLELATPRSWLPEQLDTLHPEYPLFIKPREGSAAQDTFVVKNARELAFFVDYVHKPIIQEYLPGPEITNDVICDLKGQVFGVVSRQRLGVRSGEVTKGVTIYNRAIHDACVKIATALPAVGPITVQCMMKEGRPYFTEINARLGGGIPLGIAAGADSPRWLLASAAGLPIEIPSPGTYTAGLYMTRFDDSFFLTEEDYASTSSRRL